MDEKPQQPRWRPRFTLVGLFAATALSAVGIHGYLVWQRNAAERDMQQAQQAIEQGLELVLSRESAVVEACRNSELLYMAECRMPLADKAAAKHAHLKRLFYIQERAAFFGLDRYVQERRKLVQ